MRINIEAWTVVVVGQWNQRIFTPDWVGRNVFHADEIIAEIAFNPGSFAFRYSHDDLTFEASQSRIAVGFTDISDATLIRAENAVCGILNSLPHTPISGVGINFSFEDKILPPHFGELFRFSDAMLLGDQNYVITTSELKRSFDLNDCTLNLVQVFSEDRIAVDLNYHNDVTSAENAQQSLQGKLISRKGMALDFLGRVYGIQVEENESE